MQLPKVPVNRVQPPRIQVGPLSQTFSESLGFLAAVRGEVLVDFNCFL